MDEEVTAVGFFDRLATVIRGLLGDNDPDDDVVRRALEVFGDAVRTRSDLRYDPLEVEEEWHDPTPEPPISYTIENLTDHTLSLGRGHLALPPGDPQRMSREALQRLQVTQEELQRRVAAGDLSLTVHYSAEYLNGPVPLSRAVFPDLPPDQNQAWHESLPERTNLRDLREDVDRLQKENAQLREMLETLAGTDTMVLQELLRELRRRRV